MGDHALGRTIGIAAQEALRSRRPGQSALDILDIVCGRFRGRDAEFESEDPANPSNVHPEYDDYRDPHEKAALGLLMIEAFAPHGLADLPRYAPMMDHAGHPDAELACDAWYSEVGEPFRDRYGFC